MVGERARRCRGDAGSRPGAACAGGRLARDPRRRPVLGTIADVASPVGRDAARGRLLTLGAGLFAADALVYTARNFNLSRRTFEATFVLTEQGQVTERYTKAIEQPGSEKLDVRIGGICPGAHRPRLRPGPPDCDGDWPRSSVSTRASGGHCPRPALACAGTRPVQTCEPQRLSSGARTADATENRSASPTRTLPARTWPARSSPGREARPRGPYRGGPHRALRRPGPHSDTRIFGGAPVPEGWMRDPGSGRLPTGQR